MNVYDIKSKGEWQRILDDAFQELGILASLDDTDNMILQAGGERNPLCEAIRSRKESLAFICGQTQQFMADEARTTQRPVIDFCDAGMGKFVIPLFVIEEYVGNLTACGGYVPGEEIETFLIEKNTKMSEDEINHLKKLVPEVEQEKVVEVVNRLFQEIQKYL